MELLQFELEDERVALENRLKMDPKFLENEGLALLDMQAKPVGHLFADDILRFSKISGQTLPHQHQFSNGDMVIKFMNT